MPDKNWIRPVPQVIVSYYKERQREWGVTTTYVCDCSYDPPLIMVGLERSGDCRRIIKMKKELIVNVVSDELIEPYKKIRENKALPLNKLGLETEAGKEVSAPLLTAAPVNFECQIINSVLTGSHEMFVGRIETIQAAENLITEEGIQFEKLNFSFE